MLSGVPSWVRAVTSTAAVPDHRFEGVGSDPGSGCDGDAGFAAGKGSLGGVDEHGHQRCGSRGGDVTVAVEGVLGDLRQRIGVAGGPRVDSRGFREPIPDGVERLFEDPSVDADHSTVEVQWGVVQVGLGRNVPVAETSLFLAAGQAPLLGGAAVDPGDIQPGRVLQSRFLVTGSGEAGHRSSPVKGDLTRQSGGFDQRQTVEAAGGGNEGLGGVG